VLFFEGRDLARVTLEDIERYIAVKTRTLAIKTVRNHLNTMHSVFEIGMRRRWCQTNPVKLADRPKTRKNETRIQFLNQAELDRLLATRRIWAYRAKHLPNGRHDRLAPGELIGLRWRDADLNARRVRVVSPLYVASSATLSPRAPDARSLSPSALPEIWKSTGTGLFMQQTKHSCSAIRRQDNH